MNGISWQSNKPASVVSTLGASIQNPAMYTYVYDPKYQLAGATWGTPSYTANTFTGAANNMFQEKNITYDFNGNITSLQRTNSTGALSDDFSNGYTYQSGTNKLTSVTNATTSTAYATYDYDELGRMKRETLTGAPNPYYLKYDVTGKIIGIYSDAAMTSLQESYTYDESGNRIKTVNPNGTTYYVYDSNGSVMAIYTGTTPSMSEVPFYGSGRLGTYTVSSSNYAYELRDNVGSVRLVVNRAKNGSGQADITTYNDYFPYGSLAQSGGSAYRYDYQGAYAEKDSYTGWNNFQLRMYDGRIGRWLSVDLAGQFSSPYEGMGNNPVTRFDMKGDTAWVIEPGFAAARDPGLNDGDDPSKFGYGSGAQALASAQVTLSDGSRMLYNSDGSTSILRYPMAEGKSLGLAVNGDTRGTQQFVNFMNDIIPVILTGGLGSGETLLASGGEAMAGSEAIAGSVEEGGITIIGETMARVEAAAARVPGAKILNDMPEFTGNSWQITSQMMQYNRQWILNELRSGRTIMDIGLDAERSQPSIFYQMEQNMIKNYHILHP